MTHPVMLLLIGSGYLLLGEMVSFTSAYGTYTLVDHLGPYSRQDDMKLNATPTSIYVDSKVPPVDASNFSVIFNPNDSPKYPGSHISSSMKVGKGSFPPSMPYSKEYEHTYNVHSFPYHRYPHSTMPQVSETPTTTTTSPPPSSIPSSFIYHENPVYARPFGDHVQIESQAKPTVVSPSATYPSPSHPSSQLSSPPAYSSPPTFPPFPKMPPPPSSPPESSGNKEPQSSPNATQVQTYSPPASPVNQHRSPQASPPHYNGHAMARVPLYMYNPGLARRLGISTFMMGSVLYGLTLLPALLAVGAAGGIGPFSGLMAGATGTRRRRKKRSNIPSHFLSNAYRFREMPLLDNSSSYKFISLIENTMHLRKIQVDECKKMLMCRVYETVMEMADHPTLADFETAVIDVFGLAAEREGYKLDLISRVKEYMDPALTGLMGGDCSTSYSCPSTAMQTIPRWWLHYKPRSSAPDP